ncbi:GL20065 [Drosophila persimilis]|uniref:GL20065 n=1 Tax=Drosophila persimilis TaxID=7234 RepID=B4H8D4_DROPE|nr:metchnikowin [Drosophila persimilis]EDW34969.1 GL20065 [Drosophila persimilis]
MHFNLGVVFLAMLGLLAAGPLAPTEARHRQGPIFDTRPSPFNPNPPRGGPF